MNNRSIAVIAVVALVVIVFVIILNFKEIFPQLVPPTPTLTPTLAPTPTEVGSCPNATTHIYAYGGYRYFEDPKILQILCENHGIEVKGEFRMGGYAMSVRYPHSDSSITVDCIFPASRAPVVNFEENHPGVIRQDLPTSTDLVVLYTWKDYLPSLISAGIVEQDHQVYFVNMGPLVNAMMTRQQWSAVGVNITGPVRVTTSAPEDSTSGAVWIAYLGSFLVPGNATGSSPLTLTDLQANPAILSALYDYWESQGSQDDTTIKLFNTFVSHGKQIPMAVAYETSFMAWLSTLDPVTKSEAQEIIGLYPDPAVPAELTLVSLTPACDQLQDVLIDDDDLVSIAREDSGVCPPGVICQPIDAASWWRDNDTFPALVPEPKKDVTDTIQAYIDCRNEFKSDAQCQPFGVTTTETPTFTPAP